VTLSDLSSGELRALVAPVLQCSAEDLVGLVIVGVPSRASKRTALPVFCDTPSTSHAIELLATAIAGMARVE
jgi:hypothetical protein